MLAVAAALQIGLAAQSRNVGLLASLNPSATSTTVFNDVWGYLSPSGREVALMGSDEGTHVIDCTIPTAPVQTGLIPTEVPGTFFNTWRDIKVWGDYAYVVSEAYGGMQIIELTDPDSPTKLTLWGATLWSNAHNIALDEAAGLAYVCGTDTGTHVIDVGSNPTSPTLVFSLGAPYSHDLEAQNGYAYFADFFGNTFQIYDTSQLPTSLSRLSTRAMPGSQNSHSMWPTRDGLYCVATNESLGGPVSIWDVSVKRLPQMIASYSTGPAMAIPHNPYVADRLAHLSYYTEGYRLLDLTDPANPEEVGFYDTSSIPAGGYDGAWGVYVQPRSGIVYISDVQNGLFVLKPTASPVRYGVATAGSKAQAPEIYAHGAPYLGNLAYRLVAENGPPSAPGAILFGAGRASLPLGSAIILVDLLGPSVIFPVVSDPNGTAVALSPVPDEMQFAGGVIDAQFFFLDSATPGDASASEGLEFEMFVK